MARNVNPNQIAQLNQHMTRMIDPRVLQQMGGARGLESMLKQMQSKGGPGGMMGGLGGKGGMGGMFK